jgi:tripartite-type tricarboxylate transporter receptor subunit TctC
MDAMARQKKSSFPAFFLMLSGILFAMPDHGEAQKKFPSGPVTIVVAQKAGGSTDLVARTFQPFFSRYMNTPVVVDNVEGAAGKIGRTQVYKAKPDGSTLIVTGFPASLLNQKLDNPPYKFERMTPIYNIQGGDYNAVAVPFDSPIRTIDDLKKLGQGKNIKISGSGIGNNSYLAFFFLKSKVGINATYIPYDSGSEAALSVISKQVDAGAGNLIAFAPLAEQKRIRVIAVTGPKRTPLFPDVPTLIELGYPDAGFDITLGLFGPPEVPADIARTLEEAAIKAGADPNFKEMAKKADFNLSPASASELKKMLEEQGKMLDEVVPHIKEALRSGKKK